MAKETQKEPAYATIGIRADSRRLLDLMCEVETRSIIDQVEVVIREAAERRGLLNGDGEQAADT